MLGIAGGVAGLVGGALLGDAFSGGDDNNGSDYGNGGSDYGNDGPDYGNDGPDYGNDGSDYGNDESDYGNSSQDNYNLASQNDYGGGDQNGDDSGMTLMQFENASQALQMEQSAVSASWAAGALT
jgi:hypothetical protein